MMLEEQYEIDQAPGGRFEEGGEIWEWMQGGGKRFVGPAVATAVSAPSVGAVAPPDYNDPTLWEAAASVVDDVLTGLGKAQDVVDAPADIAFELKDQLDEKLEAGRDWLLDLPSEMLHESGQLVKDKVIDPILPDIFDLDLIIMMMMFRR